MAKPPNQNRTFEETKTLRIKLIFPLRQRGLFTVPFNGLTRVDDAHERSLASLCQWQNSFGGDLVRVSDFLRGRVMMVSGGLVIGVGGGLSVRVEVVPAAVTPEGFQAHEGFVALHGPELTCALEPALVLPAGGLDGS